MSKELCPTAEFEYIAGFCQHLRDSGYTEGSIRHYWYSCRHFAVWRDRHRIQLTTVDEETLSRFGRHTCTCGGMFTRKARRNRDYVASKRSPHRQSCLRQQPNGCAGGVACPDAGR